MDRLAAGHLKADVSESHLDISLERITAATKGPIAQGYEICRAMLRLIDSSSESPIEEWREVNARLATWAADFEVEKGTLDRVFVDLKQSPLLEATCIALLGLCRTLIDCQSYHLVLS